MVTLKVGDGRLHVFNTHLDYRGDPSVRRMQVQDMLEIVADVEGPTVLVGDLNAPPDAPELRPLWDHFVDVWDVGGQGAGYTFPADAPTKRIDYILATPGIAVDSIAVVETQASDHRPVVATLTLPTDGSAASEAVGQSAVVKTGARVLAENDFERLQGKTVGLIVNHTARVGDTHLIDAIRQAGIEIGALFGPEHGLRGTADAGETVEGGRRLDGVPIYSLYDETRAPTSEELKGLDVLVFDIQGVGVRFYTYITTMGLSMQAAAEAGIPFVILDRPNPLGGRYVSGFVLESEHRSFVGKYPIPVAYGMTMGELARMVKGGGFLPGLGDLELKVVEMQGWGRQMRWPETGLPWIAPSPNLPTYETALVYAGTCFFEATTKASEGRGTRRPFTHLGAPWADGEVLADTLNARDLPGVRFYPTTFTPRPIEGMASDPGLAGVKLGGLRIEVTDVSAYQPVETGIHVLHAFYQQAQRQGVEEFFTSYIELLAGTERLRELLRQGASPEAIIASWQQEVEAFREQRRSYLLY